MSQNVHEFRTFNYKFYLYLISGGSSSPEPEETKLEGKFVQIISLVIPGTRSNLSCNSRDQE